MKQPIFTPEISDCAICGSKARPISWDFNDMYAVWCDNNHKTPDEYLGQNRAICKWNNLQLAIEAKVREEK